MNCNWPQPGGALATYFIKIAPPWLRSYEIHYLNIYRQSKRFSKPFRLIIVVKYSTRWSNISRMTAKYSRQSESLHVSELLLLAWLNGLVEENKNINCTGQKAAPPWLSRVEDSFISFIGYLESMLCQYSNITAICKL